MLLHKGKLREPTPDVREVCMGFDKDSTAGVGISDQLRHSGLGACIDCNLAKWVLQKIVGKNK